MITLAIDASTYTATVAVLRDREVVASDRVAMRGVNEERLLPAVAAALELAGVRPHLVERIVCGSGPGSFTSLRIAASIAKGMATAARVPLYAVPSLALLAAQRIECGEHYVAICTVAEDGAIVAIGELQRWPSDALRARAAGVGPLVGPGLDLPAEPDAAAVTRVLSLVDRTTPVDLASWEPAYGRLAEAQVKWEAAHGRPLRAG